MNDIESLADLAQACASDIVVVEDEVAGKELLEEVFEVVRRSDARRAF